LGDHTRRSRRLTFFPMGDGGPRKGPQDLLNTTIVDGVAWFAYDAAAITADQKLFADGREGWIAHVDGDLLLVKSFADTLPAQAAPGEAEIEIYANAGHTYVEVENQGAYVSLAPGAATTWTCAGSCASSTWRRHPRSRQRTTGGSSAQPGEVVLRGQSSISKSAVARRSSATRCRAWCKRDITVPMGQAAASAISS